MQLRVLFNSALFACRWSFSDQNVISISFSLVYACTHICTCVGWLEYVAIHVVDSYFIMWTHMSLLSVCVCGVCMCVCLHASVRAYLLPSSKYRPSFHISWTSLYILTMLFNLVVSINIVHACIMYIFCWGGNKDIELNWIELNIFNIK